MKYFIHNLSVSDSYMVSDVGVGYWLYSILVYSWGPVLGAPRVEGNCDTLSAREERRGAAADTVLS